ncbi:M23 family metallopeptidase [Aquimarina sp. 2-A2]|uniref:M23 family metallopeptidase n=1 Tax=Aquimarina sp. 2-A2 TaxID=3382644 RepID=UPI00387F029A
MRVIPLLFLFISIAVFAQNTDTTSNFIPPLPITLMTSGTFGELRSNHFHSGLDLKTNGVEGIPVIASASGTIVRIKVSRFGYGKALYIKHPDGKSSVYAHLKKFNPKIEAYVKKRQYAKESYDIQLYPKSGLLQVSQGDTIAYSGNTGGSGGPHLHFEIRDKNARPMNPMAYGIEILDTKKPIIQDLYIYPQNDASHVEMSREKYKVALQLQADGSYRADEIKAFGKLGIGVATYDQQDLAPNKNGVYAITSTVNGSQNFGIEMNRFSFSETRYINRLIDYAHYKDNRIKIEKLFIEKNNPLSVYKNVKDDGYISVQDSLSYLVKISVKDYSGNSIAIHIPILGEKVSLPSAVDSKTDFFASWEEDFVYAGNQVDVHIPKHSLYEDVYLDITQDKDTIRIHKKSTPLHRNMSIAFDVSKYTNQDKKKLYIARVNEQNKTYYCSTKKSGDRFITKTRTFGTYTLAKDTEPPTIMPLNVADNKWISNEKFLKFKINDNDSGIDSYRATINGKFILMEYDYKTGMLVYDFNDAVETATENNLKLTVKDNVGNTAIYTTTFFRKQLLQP